MGLEMLAGAGMGMLGQYMENQANAKQAQLNRDFQERMSSTAHQREVDDLKKAGLNPILSAGGGGASAPSGATATMGNILGSGVSSAMAAKNLAADLEQKDANNALTAAKVGTELKTQDLITANAKTAAVNAEATQKQFQANEAQLGDYYRYKSDSETASARAQAAKSMSDYKLQAQREATQAAEYSASKSGSELEKMQSDFGKRANTYDQIMNRVDQAVGVGATAASIAKPISVINRNSQHSQEHHYVNKKTGEITND